MKKDKIKLYFLEIILFAVLFIALFVSTSTSRIVLSIILLIFAVLVKTFLKKDKIINYLSKEVTFLMAGMGLLYVGIFYLFGYIAYSFTQQIITFSLGTFVRYIMPLSIIIVSSEIIRFGFLSQDGKIRIHNSNRDYAKALTIINMILIDLIVYINVYDIHRLDGFLALIGFVAFASVSSNLFYNYYSKRFGIIGIIVYRLITVLYVYIIPFVPNMYIYFRSFLRMVYPYVMYLVMESSYSKTTFVKSYSARRKDAFVISGLVAFMVLFTMLISCNFRYGIIVVGSGSMTGAIDKGDATIYEAYSGQKIKTGDIIIFEHNGARKIHRVVETKNVNGEVRYYTKGDANSMNDSEYRTRGDIIGISRLNIKYIGIPTLWLNELFN